MIKRLCIIALLAGLCVRAPAQVTAPTTIAFPTRQYQLTSENVSGNALRGFGWNLAKRGDFNAPIRATVKVISVSSSYIASYQSIINYYNTIDTTTWTGNRYESFWIPDSSSVSGSTVPDSLFYITPTRDIKAGDYFTIANSSLSRGEQYQVRLIYDSDSVKGTQSRLSQPVWIGYGVRSLVFKWLPNDKVGAVYRTQYATTREGAFSWYLSSDTLADSTLTAKTATEDTWNYYSGASIDTTGWMKIERIGKEPDDTARVRVDLIIRSF